jgi:predicted  nucleic acid-binding Zn-ribbon protein
MSEHEHLARIEHKLNAALQGLHVLLRNALEDNMSRLHDDLAAIAGELDTAADRVIAAKTESETSLQDVLTRFEATRDKLNAAAQDDASQGSSTGAGSGAGQVAG